MFDPKRVFRTAAVAGALALALSAGQGRAATVVNSNLSPNTGDTAWMLTSVALVLMMTIPGLALFYGGMVRRKNVIATVAQSFAITALVTVLWYVVGYSIAFGTNPDAGQNRWWGGLGGAFLKSVTMDKPFQIAGAAVTIPAYADAVLPRLAGLTWGAEDLGSALGVTGNGQSTPHR